MTDMRSIRILLNDEDLLVAQDVARSRGVDLQILPKPQLIEPVTAILIGGGILLTAKFVLDLLDRIRGGVVIDLRASAEDLVRRDRSVPFGWSLVIAADGRSVRIDTRDAPVDAAERLVKAIIDGTLTTAQEIAAAAKTALGAGKAEESPSTPV